MKAKLNKETVVDLLLTILKSNLNEIDGSVDLTEGENIKLFGGEGLLDSIGLVHYIVDVEEKLEDEFAVSVVLANEKAMSRRTSPFARVSYLAEYILEEIKLHSND